MWGFFYMVKAIHDGYRLLHFIFKH